MMIKLKLDPQQTESYLIFREKVIRKLGKKITHDDVISPASSNPPPMDFGVSFIGEKSEFQPMSVPAIEQFNWKLPETSRDYIRLEQKVLANKSTAEESSRYKVMKRDRNSVVFADRYITDYAEIQRVQFLSIKIAELQKFLCLQNIQLWCGHQIAPKQ